MRSSEERLMSRTMSHRSSFIPAIVLSRVTPALWTTTSTAPCSDDRCSAIISPALPPVMSRASAEPPMRPVTSLSSPSRAGTSRPTTCAPSRASTSAIASPMPRAAPVTSAIRPSSGRSQSIFGCWPLVPMRTTWPET